MSEFKNTLNKKAVAIKYDDNKNAAPVIVASGMGYMAERIIETANENGVPVYEDNSLATILSQLELGVQVPEELYHAIVDIYLYFLDYVPDIKDNMLTENSDDSGSDEMETPEAEE